MVRTSTVMKTVFDFENISEEECYRQYRFKKADIKTTEELLGWEGVTKRNGYRCDSLTATCILLRRLA